MPLLHANAGGHEVEKLKHVSKKTFFFCGQPPGTSGLHEAATFQVDKQVQACAVLFEDTELFA